MRRRTLLATLGSTLVAGCGSTEESLDTGPNEMFERGYARDGVEIKENIGIDRPGDVGTGGVDVEPVDDIGIDRDVEIARDIGVDADRFDQSSEFEDGEPAEKNPEATERIEAATDHLDEALAAYSSFAGRDASLLDVTPTVDRFDTLSIDRRLRAARDRLEDAAEYATEGQQVQIVGLGQVATFLEYAAATDDALVDAYDRFDFAVARLYNESYGQAARSRRQLSSHVDAAETAMRTIRNAVDHGAMRLFDGLSLTESTNKQRQLSDGLTTLGNFAGGLKRIQNGMKRVETAGGEYSRAEYQAAADTLLAANADIARAAGVFRSVPSVTGMDEAAFDVHLVARTMDQVTTDLERHASARANENQMVAREAKRAAQSQVETNETVADMSIWTGFGL